MIRLWIAEKPSMAKSIANAIGQNQGQRQKGHIRNGDDIFTWCIGHLLQPALPAAYNSRYEKWTYDDLPIIPQEFIMVPVNDVKEQLDEIKHLAARADTIIHAGDPDREGQLIIDEVLAYFNINKPTYRLLINDLNPEPIRKAAKNLKDNNEFANLSKSALLRQRADWLIGYNFTRAYTLLSNQSNTLSVGRVQTPVLALIVDRDKDIENFISKPFYELHCDINSNNTETTATWIPSDRFDDYLDDNGRLLDKNLLHAIIEKTNNQAGSVIQASYVKERKLPPLPFAQSALQTQVLKMPSVNARPDDVLNACQTLYEEHKILTYPRTDCSHLPEEQFGDAKSILAKLSTVHPTLAEMVSATSLTDKPRAYNNKKITAHHAIVPTTECTVDLDSLSPLCQTVFMECAKRFICQFLPPTELTKTELIFNIQDEQFKSTGKQITSPGYAAWYGTKRDDAPLPQFKEGETIRCRNPAIIDKETTPPKPFTSATLIDAMTRIARYVTDPKIKKVLRDTDGIGTEATRANIVKILFDRQYIVEKGKVIKSTELARRFIDCLEQRTKDPGETARWEMLLDEVAKTGDNGQYLDSISTHISQIIADLPNAGIAKKLNPHTADCPKCGSPMRYIIKGTNEFFGCTKYPECKQSLNANQVSADVLLAARKLAGVDDQTIPARKATSSGHSQRRKKRRRVIR